MPITSHIKISGYLEGMPSGSEPINLPEITNPLAVANSLHIELANGDNVIPLPSGTTGKPLGVIIIFDATSVTVKKIKGLVGGDTGFVAHPTNPLVLSFPVATPASFIINSSAAEPGKLTQFLFF